MSLASPLPLQSNAAKTEAATGRTPTMSAASAVNIDRSLSSSKANGHYRSSRIALSIVLELSLLAIPFAFLTIAYVCQELYLGLFVDYMDSFRIMDKGGDDRGYYYSLDQDVTYYHRHCTREDITTFRLNKTDQSNLLILPRENTTAEYAVAALVLAVLACKRSSEANHMLTDEFALFHFDPSSF